MSDNSDVSDSATSAFSANNQRFQRVTRLRGRMMLDDMLKQLGFPIAQYQRRIYQDNKICVTVIFQTSNQHCHGSVLPARISGLRSLDGALAEDTAAVAAIRYMEGITGTVIKDLNYNRLKQAEEENKQLRNQLRNTKKQLKKAKVKSKRLARGWFLSVRRMFSFSYQFHNVAVIANFGGEEVINNDVKAAFATIDKAARTLRSKSTRLETKLEEIRRS